MTRSAALLIGWSMLLWTVAARGNDALLTQAAALRAAPSGEVVLGELSAGTPVTEIAREGQWVRVRIDGWIPAAALARLQPAPPTARVLAVIPPSIAPGLSASLEGTLEVRLAGWLRKKKVTGTGRQVWLLPPGFDVEAAGQVTPEDRTRLDQLGADAERLTKEASRAMKESNFTEATRKHDALIKQRDRALSQRLEILALHHGRREAAARQSAIATATCGSNGLFVFPSVGVGSYRLYARLIDRALDVEWIETVDVGAAGLRIDLDETKARGLPQGPP